MANSVLKWCKTKFLNGYKHINDSNDGLSSGGLSGPDYLVRGSEEQFSLTPQTSIYNISAESLQEEVSSTGSMPLKLNLDRHKRNLRFRADKENHRKNSMENHCDGQEFAFTLYDFHGQGRVTKDDIKSLVKNIYKTVGSSTTLPACGSRTVKVKVIVSEDDQDQKFKYSGGNDLRETSCNTQITIPKNMKNSDSIAADDSFHWRIMDKAENDIQTLRFFNSTLKDENVSEYVEENRPMEQDHNVLNHFYHRPLFNKAEYHLSMLQPQQDFLTTAPTELIEAEIEVDGNDESFNGDQERAPRKVYYRKHELLQIIEENMEKNNLHCPALKNQNYSEASGNRRRKKRHSQRDKNDFENPRCCCAKHIDYDLTHSLNLDYPTRPIYTSITSSDGVNNDVIMGSNDTLSHKIIDFNYNHSPQIDMHNISGDSNHHSSHLFCLNPSFQCSRLHNYLSSSTPDKRLSSKQDYYENHYNRRVRDSSVDPLSSLEGDELLVRNFRESPKTSKPLNGVRIKQASTSHINKSKTMYHNEYNHNVDSKDLSSWHSKDKYGDENECKLQVNDTCYALPISPIYHSLEKSDLDFVNDRLGESIKDIKY